MNETLFHENKGSHLVKYVRKEPLRIQRVVQRSNIAESFIDSILNFFRDVLLPEGYPESVSSDYYQYQIWDTLQAFCSTITGNFTTRAVLKGVGVGDAEASALSATITWILKDGTGMIGRILFAWWKGSKLDCDSKKWRLFADILNDLAMVIELGVPYFPNHSMELLCVTSTMKSIVGIAGGATRASITQHQAINGNMAEISAKDGTQETVVNLVASITSIYLLGIITNPSFELPFIFLMIILHLYFNYKAVNSLIFDNLNEARMAIIMESYCNYNTVLGPSMVNKKESVFLGCGTNNVCGFQIKLGSSLAPALNLYNFEEMDHIFQLYKNKQYVLISDVRKRCIYIAFEKGCNAQSIISSYFHGVMLALATCFYNEISVGIEAKRQRNHSNPIARLISFENNIERLTEYKSNMTVGDLKLFETFMDAEFNMFLTSLHVNGWDTQSHSLYVDQWRIDWKHYSDKNK